MNYRNIKVTLVCVVALVILVVFAMFNDVHAQDEHIDIAAQITEQEQIQIKAHEMADAARCLKFEDKDTVITAAGEIWTEATKKINALNAVATYTESDLTRIAKIMYSEGNGSPTMEIAAVGWCILNRLDSGGYGDTISPVAVPGQFCYRATADGNTYKWLAKDVLIRWQYEKAGVKNAGRVLPSEYQWFSGDGKHNYFRTAFKGGKTWAWNCANPYAQ